MANHRQARAAQPARLRRAPSRARPRKGDPGAGSSSRRQPCRRLRAEAVRLASQCASPRQANACSRPPGRRLATRRPRSATCRPRGAGGTPRRSRHQLRPLTTVSTWPCPCLQKCQRAPDHAAGERQRESRWARRTANSRIVARQRCGARSGSRRFPKVPHSAPFAPLRAARPRGRCPRPAFAHNRGECQPAPVRRGVGAGGPASSLQCCRVLPRQLA